MKSRRVDVRIMSKEVFIYYHKALADGGNKIRVGCCTNKRILSDRTGVEYSTLMRVFTRSNMCYFESGGILILKVYTADIERGNQSMKRKGKGGMESFVRYVMKERSDY